jgi:hypothetical protein
MEQTKHSFALMTHNSNFFASRCLSLSRAIFHLLTAKMEFVNRLVEAFLITAILGFSFSFLFFSLFLFLFGRVGKEAISLWGVGMGVGNPGSQWKWVLDHNAL